MVSSYATTGEPTRVLKLAPTLVKHCHTIKTLTRKNTGERFVGRRGPGRSGNK